MSIMTPVLFMLPSRRPLASNTNDALKLCDSFLRCDEPRPRLETTSLISFINSAQGVWVSTSPPKNPNTREHKQTNTFQNLPKCIDSRLANIAEIR